MIIYRRGNYYPNVCVFYKGFFLHRFTLLSFFVTFFATIVLENMWNSPWFLSVPAVSLPKSTNSVCAAVCVFCEGSEQTMAV